MHTAFFVPLKDSTIGIKSGILSLFLTAESIRNPSSCNMYVVHAETVDKTGTYRIGFSTTYQPLSGRAYLAEYKIEKGKPVFLKIAESRMS